MKGSLTSSGASLMGTEYFLTQMLTLKVQRLVTFPLGLLRSSEVLSWDNMGTSLRHPDYNI